MRAVLDRLVQGLRPQEVYLFGSRAEGRAQPWSDFDLAVILDDAAPEELATYEGVYAPIRGIGVGCDVVPCRVAEFAEMLRDPSNPWNATMKKARKLYERP